MSSDTDCLRHQLPDAIIIMMNPGSSTPLEEVKNSILGDNISQLAISFVPTKRDTTQYQIMRVMYYCSWDYVRIVNISDMRDPKSGRFTDRYTDLESQTGYTVHSLFDNARKKELDMKLKKKESAPVSCAWGVSKDLDPLIKRCLGRLGNESHLFGLLKQNTINKYFHPLPTLQKDKEAWVNKMVAQLKK